MAQLSEIGGSIIGQSSFQKIPAVSRTQVSCDTFSTWRHQNNSGCSLVFTIGAEGDGAL